MLGTGTLAQQSLCVRWQVSRKQPGYIKQSRRTAPVGRGSCEKLRISSGALWDQGGRQGCWGQQEEATLEPRESRV